MTARPRLLFVSPALPRPTGNGLRMRAWAFLLGAARDHRITLVAGSPLFPEEDCEPQAHLAPLVERVIVLPWRAHRDPVLLARRLLPLNAWRPRDWALPTPRLRRRLAALDPRTFHRVHVQRLYMLPVALEILRGEVRSIDQLDLDDWESETRRQIARLPASPERAGDAAAYAQIERQWLPRLRTVLVCSEPDRRAIIEHYGRIAVEVQPNAVEVPPQLLPPTASPHPALLFVGALGYRPNADALRAFVLEVLPALRRVCPEIRLCVVGGGAPCSLCRLLAASPAVHWLGPLPSMDPAYDQARSVVVPLRAGGGTRLKVLEAFARG